MPLLLFELDLLLEEDGEYDFFVLDLRTLVGEDFDLVRFDDPLERTLGIDFDFDVLFLLDTLGLDFVVRLEVFDMADRFDGALEEVFVRTFVGVLDILPCELSFLIGFFETTRIELSVVFLVREDDDDVSALLLFPIVDDLRIRSTREVFLLPEATVAICGIEVSAPGLVAKPRLWPKSRLFCGLTVAYLPE